jgi:hypothetical protein
VTSEVRPPAAGRPVLVLGLPRSGTTWTAHLLGCAPGTVTVLEPDNEKTTVTAIDPKRRLGRFPVLDPGEDAGPYRDLWARALAGGGGDTWSRRLGGRLFAASSANEREAWVSGHPSARLRLAGYLGRPPAASGTTERTGLGARRVVAKSVHGCLAAEWLADAFALDVVVVLRHPANVLASWLELDLPDRDRRLERLPAVQERYMRRWGIGPPGPDPLERVVWQLGLMTAALEEAVARQPQWRVQVHEEMCADPTGSFRRLYGELGLEWTGAVEAEIKRGDQAGSGFDLQRRTQDVADSWRTRLGPLELDTLRRVLSVFPLQHWSSADMRGDTCAG